MLRFAQHDNMGVSTCHAERSEAESKHLKSPMPNVHWITVVYLAGQENIHTTFRTFRSYLSKSSRRVCTPLGWCKRTR